jgi:membrane protease YdiL (CAAX protease family)
MWFSGKIRQVLIGKPSAVFSFFHLPNPFLTVAAFVAGVLACIICRKAPNLYVIGRAHGLLTVVFEFSLYGLMTVGMKISPCALG